MVDAKLLFALVLSFFQPLIAASADGSSVIRVVMCSAPPAAPTIVLPPDGSTVTAPSVTVSGIAQAGAQVRILVGGVQQAQVAAASSGSYEAAVPLQPGVNSLTATATDGCGTSVPSASTAVTYQQVVPGAPTINSPPNGSSTTDGTLLVSGVGEPLSTVTIYRNGVVAGEVQASLTGSYSLQIALAVGQNTLTAQARNGAGSGPVSAPITVTRTVVAPQPGPPPAPTAPPAIDRAPQSNPVPVAPGAPSITSPTSGAVVNGDNVTVSGQAQARSTVIIRLDGREVARVAADDAGQFRASIPLLEGQNSITVEQIGGTRSAPTLVTRLLIMSAPPVIESPQPGAVLSRDSVTVNGRALPGSQVLVRVDGKLVGSVRADSSGRFSLSVSLERGANEISASAEYGGVSLSSQAVTVYVRADQSAASIYDAWREAMNQIGAALLALPAFVYAVASAIVLTASNDGWLGALVFVSLAAALSMRGWYGLEQAWALLMWRRHHGVRDALTGKPIRLASWRRRGLNGWLVHKAGYKPLELSADAGSEIPTMQPQPLYSSTIEFLASETLMAAGLFGLVISGVAAATVAPAQPMLAALIAAAIMATAVTHIIISWNWPRTRWFKVAHREADLEVLGAGANFAVAKVPVTNSGYAALWLEPGSYVIRAGGEGGQATAIHQNRAGYVRHL